MGARHGGRGLSVQQQHEDVKKVVVVVVVVGALIWSMATSRAARCRYGGAQVPQAQVLQTRIGAGP